MLTGEVRTKLFLSKVFWVKEATGRCVWGREKERRRKRKKERVVVR